MAILHLRVVCPDDLSGQVAAMLGEEPGATGIVVLPGAVREPAGDLIEADLARESVQGVLNRLRQLQVDERGSVSWSGVDTAIGDCISRAERDAPGSGTDALIWEEVVAGTGEDATLTWTFMAFMVLACLLAAIGVATNSPITIVGAMVVGPEFGPLAAIAVGLRLRRWDSIRRAVIALFAGFTGAIAVTAAVAVIWRVSGLVSVANLTASTGTAFIYQPGWFSLITALVAGAAGTLSLTSSKSAALVGVFISVTTIPAAGNMALALVFGRFHEAGGSALQLIINLTGIVAAGYLVMLTRGRSQVPDERPDPDVLGHSGKDPGGRPG